jgi:hypothetical protein
MNGELSGHSRRAGNDAGIFSMACHLSAIARGVIRGEAVFPQETTDHVPVRPTPA